MINIVTALHCEAKPIIERLDLKRDLQIKPFQVFKSDHAQLIVSGIGRLRAAIATTFLIANRCTCKSDTLFNIGICGAKLEFPIGDLFIVNKLTDEATSRQFYPDLLLRHNLAEAHLRTFDHPVAGDELQDPDFDIVDMEGAAFFEAASIFLGPNQIFCLKVVSDHLESSQNIDEEGASALISSRVGDIESFILAQSELNRNDSGILSDSEREILATTGTSLKLSFCEKLELHEMARGYKIRTKTPISTDLIGAIDGATANTRKSAWGELRRKLSKAN